MDNIPRRWKAFQLDYDDLVVAPETSCCVCLSERSMRMILAVADQWHWTTRYYSDTGATIDGDLIDAWASKLEAQIVAGMNNCCGGGYITRIGDNGQLEVSYDGGATWTPAPDQDPRNTSIQFPPLPDSITNQACAGAENATANFEAFVDQLADILDAGGGFTLVVGAVIALASFWLSGGTLAALIIPVMGGFISAGGSSIRAAIDSDVLEAFKCCVFSNIQSDASFTDITAVLDCINEDITGLANTLAWNIVNWMGPVGLTNWARTGSADGDGCDGCECEPAEVGYDLNVNVVGGTQGFNGPFPGTLLNGTSSATFTIPDRGERTFHRVRFGNSGSAGSGTWSCTVGGETITHTFGDVGFGDFVFDSCKDTDTIVFSQAGSLDAWWGPCTIDYDCC